MASLTVRSIVDGWMRRESATTSGGGDGVIVTGEDNTGTELFRSIVKFAMDAVPKGSTINTATARLTHSEAGNWRASNSRTVRWYRCLRTVTESMTWNTYDGTNNWGTAGADNTTTDRESSDIGNASVSTAEADESTKDFTLTAASVQAMLDGGAFTNNGFVVRVDTEDNDRQQWHSNNSATYTKWPQLILDLTYPTGTIEQDSSSNGNNTTGNSLTISHTIVSGNNRILVVVVAAEDAANATDNLVSGITYGGVALTKVLNQVVGAGPSNNSEIWYLLAPAVGTADIVITTAGSCDGIIGFGIGYKNARQQAPHTSNSNSQTSSTNELTTSVTTDTDNEIIVVGTSSSTGTGAGNQPRAGQTLVAEVINANLDACASWRYKGSAAAVTVGVNPTGTPARYALTAIAIRQAEATALQDPIGLGVVPFPR